MGVANTLTAAVLDFTTTINGNMKPALTQVTVDFYRLTSESGVTPVRSGALRRSAMISSTFSEGTVRWSTPYARRRNIEGSITGIPLWDITTFEQNEELLVGNYASYLIKNKGENIS